MFFRRARKRGDLSTAARIRAEIAYWLKVLLVAVGLSMMILLFVFSNISYGEGIFSQSLSSPVPIHMPPAIGTYNAHWHNDLCNYRNKPISCMAATATAQANPAATESGMCCLH